VARRLAVQRRAGFFQRVEDHEADRADAQEDEADDVAGAIEHDDPAVAEKDPIEKAALDEANEQHPRDQAQQGQSPDELANVQAHGWLDLVESHLLDFLLKYACTSWATRAHRRLPALSVRQLLSSLSAVSTHSATGPPGKYRMPASVLALLTDPVLCATTTLGGRKRVNLSLSSHFLRCSSISLHASGLTALPRWTF